MCRESACGFVCTVSAEISIVSVNSGSVIFSLDSLWHILLGRARYFRARGSAEQRRASNERVTKQVAYEKELGQVLHCGTTGNTNPFWPACSCSQRHRAQGKGGQFSPNQTQITESLVPASTIG